MRGIHHGVTPCALTIIAILALGVAPARAAITADFNAGAGTFPDAPGSGWSNAWQDSGGVTATVVNAAPIDAGTNYLTVDGTGTIRLVARQYESFDDVDVSQPHTISWKYRLDAPDLSQFTAFNDRVNFFARGTAGLGGATSAADSWEILSTGATHSSGALPNSTQFHVFDGYAGGGFGPDTVIDTGMPLTPGDVYAFEVAVDPTRQTYAVRIDNETAGTSVLRNRLGYRNTGAPADSFTYLHLGGRTSAGGDTMPASLDSVNLMASPGLDGIISYGGTAGPGGVSELTDLVVRRDGVDTPYLASELIGATLTHFKGGSSTSNILVPADSGDPADRAALLGDFRFDTGVINPGGSDTPLTSDPIIDPNNPGNSTPGFAVMFDQPVENAPGPDVVLFEVQTSGNPSAGDAFHVSPLTGLGSGLNSITVNGYDVQFGDMAALVGADFDLFQFSGSSPMSLDGLQNNTLSEQGGNPRQNFQLMAVAFDLSELGYAEGISVPGLFFQDNLADSALIDPVLIAGLPGPPIPEPATAVLLACGGLALLRRRRAARCL